MASVTRRYAVPIIPVLIIFVFLLYEFFPLEPARLQPVATSILVNPSAHMHQNSNTTVIPNLVHYVWFLLDTNELRFDFEHFVSIYSAHYYFQPDKICINTNATPEQVAKAKESGNKWTRIILSLPEIEINRILMPIATNTGKPIDRIEHRSDFARTEVLYTHGGIYMDMDIIPIRSITALLQSGFANIVGQELNGGINSGMTMHAPHSTLLTILRTAQHEVFDGEWTTHSTLLLTELSNRLVPMPAEVLILQKNAFAPGSWTVEDTTTLLGPHKENSSNPLNEGDSRHSDEAAWPVPRTAGEAIKYWEERLSRHSFTSNDMKREEWEIDYSSSYVIHAFHNSGVPDWDNKITLKYVRARQSNYARAVWPAIWHAISTGVITEDETGEK